MDDLISEFITETAESLATLDTELVRFEKEPSDSEALGNIFRLVHTIKGTCGFLGLSRLETIAHASESILGEIRDNAIPVSPEVISGVLESLDTIKSIVEYLKLHGKEQTGDDSELISRLNTLRGAGDQNKGTLSSQPEETDNIPAASETPAAQKMPEHDADASQDKNNTSTHAEEANEHSAQGSAQAQSIRVNLDVLENLMQLVGELVLTRNQLSQIIKTRSDRVLSFRLQKLSQIASDLQEGIMKTRMQPISNAWSKFPRLIRDLSHELEKKIDLRMIGAETELDRQLLEAIKDPLIHMVRNSCDHGLESPEERVAAGKPEAGTITLSAFHEGGHIIIELSDDGRGINIEKIKQRALKNGLATEEQMAKLTGQQIVQFIFLPGFSTAEKVTSISGRGIGMDVVRYNIEKIGGTLELTSIFGKGSKFNIKIPLTLAIVSVLIVETCGERFALPQINVQELVRVGEGSGHVIEHVENASVLRLRGKLLPVISLAEILGMSMNGKKGNTEFVVICKVGGYSFGIAVEHVFDIEEIVIKPNSELLKSITLYSGNAILGDGNIIMILDPNGLARATGAEDISSTLDTSAAFKDDSAGGALVSYLLFKSQKGAPKAVPLELISRLEKIDMAKVEIAAGKRPVVQYKGSLMSLRTLGDEELPKEGLRYVIVFTYDNRNLGIVIDRILDVVRVPYDVKSSSVEKGLFGSTIIDGKTTDIVDVAYMLRDIVGISDVEGAFAKSDRKYELLLVEDSMFFRGLTVPLLISVGYKVTAVNNVKEAVQALENKSDFDVIVSDIEMPGIDGYALAELCRNDPRFSHIPLFAFTSNKNEQAIEKSRKSGFRDMILKTDRAALLKSIAACFKEEKEGGV